MAKQKFDFSGYATRNDLRCSDGRVIKRDAFKHNDGQKVPLVWNHQHDGVNNVLGHAYLENREDGVYAYASLNNTPQANDAKEAIKHGDVKSLSIYANKLKEQGSDVIHGVIREVSLVLAGANPGAYIDTVLLHGDGDSGLIINYDEDIVMTHADSEEEDDMADTERTVIEVIESMTEEQQEAMRIMMDVAAEDAIEEFNNQNGGNNNMKHNLFENEGSSEATLSHAELNTIMTSAKKNGSLKDAVLAHADQYGIENIDFLFPDATTLGDTPDFIKRETGWVAKVMNGVKHTPFSRIRTVHADITEDAARAKGYIKGKRKKEEVFSLLKRATTPTTIYKKQKLDRDDTIDITDFEIVAWLKAEMRIMIDEEIARAALIGDGRLADEEDKISESNIRPIWKDDELYSIKVKLDFAANDDESKKAAKFIKHVIKSRKLYKGSGTPTLFTTEDVLTECLLLEDTTGRRIYTNVADLATALRVSEIVTVEVMEDASREVNDVVYDLYAILVNLSDYAMGADKGGAINMFDDFDIDYNQLKYLMETRCSGALIKPHSAIVFEAEKKNIAG